MLPLYLSPAPRFPHQALAGHTTNFGQKIWGEENRCQSSRSKILGQLLKNIQTPILLTVPTGPAREREGWRGNTHERDGGFDRIGNRCNRGGYEYDGRCTNISTDLPLNQCLLEGATELACRDSMRYMMSHFIESRGLFYFSMLYTYEAKGGKA